MKMKSDTQPKLVAAVVSIFLFFNFSQIACAANQPCPAAAELTLAQKAAQWVTAFQKPYCDYLTDLSASILQKKVDSGVLHQALNVSRIFRASGLIGESDGSVALSRLYMRIRLKNPTVGEMAAAKRRVLRAGTAVTAYTAGKKAFEMANQVDSALSGFAPTSFDFASKQQIQKDAAKLAHLRGLIQSQELRLGSLTKMLDSLGEEK